MQGRGQIDFKEKQIKREKLLIQAHEAAISDEIKTTDINLKKFDDLLAGSEQILIHIKSVFPFDLFPDELLVDINKVSIVNRDFFGTEGRQSFFIQDIQDLFVYDALIFASIKIVGKAGQASVVTIKHLKPKEAQKARDIIQGLVVAKEQGIDLTALAKLPTQDLVNKFEDLGKTQIK